MPGSMKTKPRRTRPAISIGDGGSAAVSPRRWRSTGATTKAATCSYTRSRSAGHPRSDAGAGPTERHVSLATMVEYMDGEIDTLPLGPSPRRPGVPDVAR